MSFTKIDIMFNNTDRYGNVLVAEEVQEGLYNVRLKQANEARYRELGQLQEMETGFQYVKMEKEEDRLFKTKAWSIHSRIISFCSEVLYITDKARYRISTKKAISFGIQASYQATSNTTKTIVPIRHWEIEWGDRKEAVFINRFGYEWFDELKEEFSQPYFSQIGKFIAQRREVANVYPGRDEMFKAFKITPFLDVKVVILGDEPYNNGSANGLAFGITPETLTIPALLQGINDAVEQDVYDGFSLFKRTTLEEWARQGVMLLNINLSTEEGKKHQQLGWQRFTFKAIQKLSMRPGKPIVFILLNFSYTAFLEKILSGTNHLVLSANVLEEKSPVVDCFSRCNSFLKQVGYSPVNW